MFVQLALFYKWEEELQNRKTELAEKVANLSPDARDALEKWKELKFKVTATQYLETKRAFFEGLRAKKKC